MSTREIAYSIIDQLEEDELQAFIALFRRIHAPQNTVSDEMEKRMAAFERMKKACRYIPDLDEKKALAEHREEKYGQ